MPRMRRRQWQTASARKSVGGCVMSSACARRPAGPLPRRCRAAGASDEHARPARPASAAAGGARPARAGEEHHAEAREQRSQLAGRAASDASWPALERKPGMVDFSRATVTACMGVTRPRPARGPMCPRGAQPDAGVAAAAAMIQHKRSSRLAARRLARGLAEQCTTMPSIRCCSGGPAATSWPYPSAICSAFSADYMA